MTFNADAADRQQTYRRLVGRNRVVGVLRLAVPAMGALVLGILLLQIYISSLGSRFGVGQISVTRENITVDSPEYAGLLEDGSAYHVWARSAKAAINATDQIDLTDAALTRSSVSGITMLANALEARLDTTRQLVLIEDLARVEDSTGTSGTVRNSVFDYAKQTLTGDGPVHIDYADGTTIDASGIYYDAQAQSWSFTNASVTLPATPGAETTEKETP